ncbi:type I-E CRISPR-associated protein Cas5/CasD [Streptomyces sp. NPDC048718]|uniref:type I-E CRISPR-associated protein Cas5/CasD n=1 Tax=Streptomyces sp. NPDC048718 TaxID=3365587 RepID=UPI0037206451
MSDGLIMHLSGPFQSYGGPAQANLRPTYRQPTRSALTGMIACCLGRERDADNTDLAQLSYTVRVDRPGTILADFHTIGGNHDPVFGLTTAEGKTRDAPIVSTRYYLSDAAFTLAVTGPTPVLDLTAQALTHPVWAPYLGRRSCPPDTPLLLTRSDHALEDLDHIPLHRPTHHTGPVTYVHDSAPTLAAPSSSQFHDQPVPGHHRAWTTRPIWEQQRTIPAPNGGLGTAWLNALADHLGIPTPAKEDHL